MSINGPIKIVNDGLVLCLDAANLKSYIGSGTIWNDLTKNTSAVKAGSQSPTYPQFTSTGWFNFTGGIVSDNYSRFDVSNIPSFSALSAFAWYRTSDTTASKTIIRMDNSDFELSVNNNTNVFYCAGTNWDDIAVSITQANATNGKWHYTGLTFNGTVLNAYFDTVLVGTSTRGSSTTTAAGTLRIGTRDDAYNQHFVGDISMVKIYNKVLSASEILRNYNATKSRYGL